jgi:hypothetical protein
MCATNAAMCYGFCLRNEPPMAPIKTNAPFIGREAVILTQRKILTEDKG